MEQLSGKVAVVTGAGSGVGLAIARELGAAGCRLSLADIDAEALQRAGDALGADGLEVMTHVTDVGQLPEVEALAEATLAEFGAAHVVVNNAGVIAWNPIEALTIGDWRWVVDVNIWGVIHGVHVFLPILERQGTEGHFVNVASVGGVLADTPFMSTYSATKAAVIGLSLTLASELSMQQRPVGVSIVCPSATRDGYAHFAERNRPASLGPLARRPEAQALLDLVADLVAHGQPIETVARRVVEAVRRNDLWVFPHPEAAAMLQPRLDALGEVLRVTATQAVSD
jgi:NAD(P)-dependent dehydrogenase (short-subunit alcohol dehydrogenase family)